MLWRVNVRNDISDLLDFIGQNDVWRDRLQDVIAEHLMPALEEFEIDNSDLLELLGEPWPGVLWGCGFEDFLGRRYSEDNIVDLYLKRRGWNETALNRDYFAALRDTPVSLYEVTEVKQGRSMVLQNRQVRILRPIVHPAASFLLVGISDILHRSAVGSKFVSDQDMRAAVAPH